MDEAEERAKLMKQYQNKKGKNQVNMGPPQQQSREEVKQPSQADQRSVKSYMSKPQASRQDDAISYKSDMKSVA